MYSEPMKVKMAIRNQEQFVERIRGLKVDDSGSTSLAVQAVVRTCYQCLAG